jgi:hypothetical protein
MRDEIIPGVPEIVPGEAQELQRRIQFFELSLDTVPQPWIPSDEELTSCFGEKTELERLDEIDVDHALDHDELTSPVEIACYEIDSENFCWDHWDATFSASPFECALRNLDYELEIIATFGVWNGVPLDNFNPHKQALEAAGLPVDYMRAEVLGVGSAYTAVVRKCLEDDVRNGLAVIVNGHR